MAKPRQSISLASGFRFTDSSSPLPPPASFEDKVKHVKEVYQTDTEDPTTTDFTPVLDLGNVISLPSPGSKPATKNEGLQVAGLHSLVNENPSNTTKKDKTTVSLTIRTKSPPRRGAVAHSSRESSAKAMQVSVFGESDEQLSEISDIEPENGTLKQPHSTPAPRRGREKKATLATTAIPGSPVPTRKPPKRTIKRKRIIDSDDEVSGTSVVNGSKEPAKTTSKIKDDAEGTVGNPLETEKPPSTRDSSEPNPSIDFSAPLEADFLIPTLPLTGTEVASRQGTASDGFTVSDPNAPTAPGVVDGGHCNARPVFDSSTKEPISLSSSGGKIEQHSSRRVPAAGVVRNEACSPAKPSEETGPPPRIAGSRRKREDTKPSDELAAVDAEDEPAPQKKKSREARNEEPGEMPDKDPSGQRLSSSGPVITNSVRLTKRYGKNTKASPVSAGPTVVNFDELPKESKPTRSSTRRMGKFKEKLTTPTRGTRTTAMRGKDGKPANARLTTTVKSDAVSLKETSVQISRAAVATRKDHSSLNSSTLVHDMARVYTSKAENIVPEAKLNVVQEAPKAIAVQPHKSNRASAKAKKAPWEDPKFAQHVSSDPIPPESEVEVHVKKEIPNAELLVAGFDAMSNDVIQSDDVIEYSTPLKGGSEDLVELACDLPTKRSTPGKEAVTIDLTRDDSPVQKKPQVLKASAPPVEAAPASSETEVRATMRASDRFVCADIQDVTCELTLPPSPPRRKRLSVTFASPVEHPVPDDATPELTKTRPKGPRLAGTRSVQTQTVTDYLGSPTDTTPSSRLLSVSKDHALSPLGVPRMFANDTPGQSISSWVTPQQSKVYLSNKGTRIAPIPVAHEPISDEVEIQDIVDVLNDIQDVIIEGVSKRFKNVKNHVRAVRDRFMQQALDDLQDMAIENAKHFNGLVSLEEEYHKYRKTSAHRWEELIDCNESISAHFQHALKEHDQNMSAKMFPKSLLPEKPLFPSRRQKV